MTRPGSLRIAMFVHTLDDRAVAQHTAVVAERLRLKGHHITFVCAVRKPTGHVPSGIPVVDLGLGRHRTAFGIWKLARWLRATALDALFGAGNGPSRAAVAARLLSRRPPCVVTVEQIHYSSFQGRWWRDRLMSFLYPRADVVAGVSESVVEDLVERFPRIRKTAVLRPPGPSPAETLALADRPPEHEWFARGGSHIVLSCVGNLIPRKAQDVLIDALGILKESMPTLRLVLVGRRDDQRFVSALERRAEDLGVSDRIWFAGFQPNPLPFMRFASIFALASRSEGSPNVLAEALACGVPVIATDSPGGSRDVLERGASGLLVPPDDPEAMAHAISRLAQDDDLRARLVERGLARSLDFDPDEIAQRHVEIVESCLSRGEETRSR